MKKVSFDTIDKMTAPEEWVNKALSIPEEQSKRKSGSIPFWQYSIAFAACLVAAAAVTVTLFTLTRDKDPIVIKENVPVIVMPTLPTREDKRVSEESRQPTEQNVIYIDGSEASFRQDVVQGTDTLRLPAASQSVLSTQSETLRAAQPSTETSDAPIIPTISAIEDSTVTATEYVTEPAYIQTEPATQHATESATQHATESATQLATEPGYIHTEPVTQNTMEPVAEYVDTIERGFYIPEWMDVYCKITDTSGNILYGDEDLSSQQHLCTVTERTRYQTFCSYSPKELGVLPERGCYLCSFYTLYDETCVVLLSEKVYLNN